MPDIKEFLNPTSMLTPGIAGGLTVSISMPLVFAFGLKFKWVSLAVSFLFGLLIVMGFTGVSKYARPIYCVLNTLVIFSLSIGAATNIDSPPQPPMPPAAIGVTTANMLSGSYIASIDWSWLGIRDAAAEDTFDAEQAQPGSLMSNESEAENDSRQRRSQFDNTSREWGDYQRRQQAYQQQQREYEQRWSW